MDPDGLSELQIRILRHMVRFRPERGNGYDGNPELTQGGIAEVVSCARSNVAKNLADLIAHGLVDSAVLHVGGRRRRVHNYWLSDSGRRFVESMFR
jgi:DNA-binding MarR family transcriptional regulator